MHQAKFGHGAATAALESGEIIGAKLNFELLQFGIAASSLSTIADDGIEGGESFFTGNFRLMKNSRGQLSRSVIDEDIVDAAIGFDGELLFEHQLAVYAAGAATVQGL